MDAATLDPAWEPFVKLLNPAMLALVPLIWLVTGRLLAWTPLKRIRDWGFVVAGAIGILLAFGWTAAGKAPVTIDTVWSGAILGAIAALSWKAGHEARKGATGKALLPLVLAALVLAAPGCAAPGSVREAQVFEESAWMTYVRNTGRIHDLTLSLYATERTKAIDYTTVKALEKVRAAGVDGKLPVAEFEAALKTLVEERDKALSDTEAIKSKVRALIAVNDEEMRKALRIRGRMTEWLEAGIDETAIPGLAQEVLQAAQEFGAAPK